MEFRPLLELGLDGRIVEAQTEAQGVDGERRGVRLVARADIRSGDRLGDVLDQLRPRLPAGRTSLEALRNYEQSLKQKGFEVPFTCSTEAGACFTGNERWPGLFLGLALDGKTDLPKFDGDFVRNQFGKGNGRYLYAKRSQGGQTIHVSVAFGDDEGRGGRPIVARVIGSGQMETDKIQVKQQAKIRKDFDDKGRTQIYGILGTRRPLPHRSGLPHLARHGHGAARRLERGRCGSRVEPAGRVDPAIADASAALTLRRGGPAPPIDIARARHQKDVF